MLIEKFELRLVKVCVLNTTTWLFRFVRTDDEPVNYQPGQFLRFTFDDEKGSFERSYSIATFEGTIGCSKNLDLLISSVEGGRASRLLFESDADELVQNLRCSAKGPYGRLVLPTKMPKRLIMVATSVGLAPFLPILNQLDQIMQSDSVAVELILGVRSPDQFIYGEKLIAYDASHPNFNLTVCYSREMPVEEDARAESGYVQKHLLGMALAPKSDRVLLCGNPHMIDDSYGELKMRGFGVRNVVREKYIYAREPVTEKKQELSETQKRLIAEKLAGVKNRQSDH